MTKDPILRLSGTDVYNHTADKNFLMIGERTNVAGSPRFRKLIQNNDLETALADKQQSGEAKADARTRRAGQPPIKDG